MDLLIGTSNPGKLGEYEELLTGLTLRLLTLRDVGLGDMDVPEDATTLEENAMKKALAYSQASGLVTLADDTGLYVDALDGRPGVYPARYGGPGLTMGQRRQKLLGELEGVEDGRRTARFECIIAVADPRTNQQYSVKGVCPGRIAQEEREGGSGFGYDALFIPQGYDVVWSLVAMDEKNSISHRGQAAKLIVPILDKIASTNEG
jgi:XTP/dITP diphosphohydrolase